MIELGRFQIDLGLRMLYRDGEAVHIGSRAFDILAVIASGAGRLVTRDELMNAVWPDTVVEENNLQVHLSALRKILGGDRDLILTVPGRGYQLVPRNRSDAASRAVAQQAGERRAASFSVTRPAPVDVFRPLPSPKTRLVGRDVAIARIRALLTDTHVLTLVGAGGIGKTSLAIEAARRAAVDFSEPVCFVELATLTTHDDVLAAIAEACGVHAHDTSPTIARIAASLVHKRVLLVLDNAEHVIDHIAGSVEALAAECDHLCVLVTSREPLRITPEKVFRVDPLDVPHSNYSAVEILQQSAVNLFLLRANMLQQEVGVGSPELPLVGEICRRLDGIPLAIELAAARVTALGVEGVYRRLDDRLSILTGGYRTALPRHQTLRATFDWSFAMLDGDARTLFRRIAVFGGVFTFEAMCAVVCDSSLTVADVISGISELLAKSLANVEFDGPVARYRLPESTRAYALEKLQAEGERQTFATRHARYLSTCIQAQSDAESADMNPVALQHTFDDARSAFDWAFSPEGDLHPGVELAANLANALIDGGMIAEGCERAALAVEALDRQSSAAIDTVSEMRVRAALASALPAVNGSVARSAELWREVLALALASGDQAFQARALWGLWNTMISCGRIYESMNFARQLQQCAAQQGNTWQTILADQSCAISQHCLGQHADARSALLSARERLMHRQGETLRHSTFTVDPLVYCNGTLARIAWLQGDIDEATMLLDTLVSLVKPDTIEPSLTHTLGAVAAPLALMSGDFTRANAYLEVMASQAALHRLEMWQQYCSCLHAYRDVLDGHTARALPVMTAAIDTLIARGFRRLITLFVVACADALIAERRTREAASRLNDAMEYCERHGEFVFLPELWRALGKAAHAEALMRASAADPFDDKLADATHCFTKAIELARDQGARMWELRATLALSALLRDEGRSAEAHAMLEAMTPHFDVSARAADIQTLFATVEAQRSSCARRIINTPLATRRRNARYIEVSFERVVSG